MENNFFTLEFKDWSLRHSSTTGDAGEVSLALHAHDLFEIFVLKSESATFFVEGTIYHMKKDDMILFNSTELHNISFDNSTAYERFVIHFQPETVLPYERDDYNLLHIFTARKPGKGNLITKEELVKTDVPYILKKIEDTASVPCESRSILLHTLLIQLLIEINKAKDFSSTGAYPAINNEKIRAILSYINSNLSEDLSLDALSEKFYMSKYNMCHIFKQNTGFSVKQYITYKRVGIAQKLMASGKSTLDACIASGFNDYSNFYKTFKKILGKPPKDFK